MSAARSLTVVPPVQNEYPWVPWNSVRSVVDDMWDPENAPHHSLIGLTGSGKSHLAVHGILEGMCQYDRVLIVDTKGDDKVVSKVAHPVKALPKHTWYSALGRRRDEPRDKWYRLVVPDRVKSPAQAQDVVGSALERVYEEGDWVVYVDECWEISGTGNNGLGLEAPLASIWRKGRARHVSLITATQTPVAVPRLFYDQASFAWIGRIRDEERQKRLCEIGGLSKRDLPVLSTLKRREWLLAADNGEYFARTIVTSGRG